MILLCFGQCHCQSVWMDGTTSCSWVFVCVCAHVHVYTQSQRFGPLMIKTQKRFFDMPKNAPKNAPNSSERQHRKNFVVRNDDKVARRINATPDVTTRPPVFHRKKASPSVSIPFGPFRSILYGIRPMFHPSLIRSGISASLSFVSHLLILSIV